MEQQIPAGQPATENSSTAEEHGKNAATFPEANTTPVTSEELHARQDKFRPGGRLIKSLREIELDAMAEKGIIEAWAAKHFSQDAGHSRMKELHSVIREAAQKGKFSITAPINLTIDDIKYWRSLGYQVSGTTISWQ